MIAAAMPSDKRSNSGIGPGLGFLREFIPKSNNIIDILLSSRPSGVRCIAFAVRI